MLIFTKLNFCKNIIRLIFIIGISISCKRKADPIGYIYLENFLLATTSSQGENSSSIVDGWFYVDGKLINTQELPAKIPVSTLGTVEVSILPGIKVSGQTGIRNPYPFYKAFDTIINIRENITDTLKAHTSYQEFSDFLYIEEFETNTPKFKKIDESDTSLVVENSIYLDGAQSGLIHLNNEQTFAFIASDFNLTSSQSINKTYLELDYYNDFSFNVGIYYNLNGINLKTPVLSNIFAKEKWNKLYIDLTNSITALPSNQAYEVYFEIVKSDKSQSASVLLDNVKIVQH